MLACLAIMSCSEPDRARTVNPDLEKYGGVLKINFGGKGPVAFFPQKVSLSNSVTISKLGYETLLRYNDSGSEIEGLLAKKWEINEAGDEYTIYLNENIYFHDDECFPEGEGRELNSEDVAYCFTQLCQKSELNRYSSLISKHIVGGMDVANNSLENSNT